MFTRMILSVFVVLALSGCTTGPKKQLAQSQPVVSDKSQELYSRDYDNNDTWSTSSYEKSVKQSKSETSLRLSPKQIQRALKKAGFYKGEIDGKIGPKTRAAIIKFQKSCGLRDDGIVGKKTSVELNKFLTR
ncbi:MAG: peptidoglycan-binding domain-containing protein [Candidatus Omnitrophota bacterium]